MYILQLQFFLTLYMYISCLKNVHVQLDNFSIPMLMEHVLPIRIPFFIYFFHTVSCGHKNNWDQEIFKFSGSSCKMKTYDKRIEEME